MRISNENINEIMVDSVRPTQLVHLRELQPIYDNANSFYKKAYIGKYNNEKFAAGYLISYDTIVACVWQNQLRIYGYFSQTTARHIREFAKQNGFTDTITKQDMLNTCVFSK